MYTTEDILTKLIFLRLPNYLKLMLAHSLVFSSSSILPSVNHLSSKFSICHLLQDLLMNLCWHVFRHIEQVYRKQVLFSVLFLTVVCLSVLCILHRVGVRNSLKSQSYPFGKPRPGEVKQLVKIKWLCRYDFGMSSRTCVSTSNP